MLSIALALALFLQPRLLAQGDPVDAFIQAEMKRQNIPSLSLVVTRDGQLVKSAGYGLANRQLRTPASPETVYKIGSVSKQFIATGIMLLVQEGRIRVEDPVGKYLDGSPPAWNGITVRHLLTHTSGLIREAPGFDPFKIQNDADVIRSAYSQPLRFAPGEKWEYSNLGYFALAEIIHVVSGESWSEYLSRTVFRPSGMHATRPTTTSAQIANRAKGYTDNDRLLDAADWPAVRPSGAFLSTVLDLAKWEAVLHTGKILSDASRQQVWTRVTLNDGSSAGYGFGWHVGSVKSRRTVYHGGGLPGFDAMYQRFIDDRLAVVVLMNTDDGDSESIALGVAALYLPQSVAACCSALAKGRLVGPQSVLVASALTNVLYPGPRATTTGRR